MRQEGTSTACQFFSDTPDDGGIGSERFQTAALTAVAARAIQHKGYMPQFAHGVTAELPIDDETTADSTPDGNDGKMLHPAPVPEPLLGNRQRVHIVLEVNRQTEMVGN